VSTTIRVTEQTKDRFPQLAKVTGRSMIELLDEAADALERRVFFDQFDAGYADLLRDPAAWAEIDAERAKESRALDDRSA
jgi:predicted transcriptional regulator